MDGFEPKRERVRHVEFIQSSSDDETWGNAARDVYPWNVENGNVCMLM